MNGQIIQGFGYRDSEHFRYRALRLGFGVDDVMDELHQLTKDGQPVSELLTWSEVHDWLDDYEFGTAESE